MTNEEHGKRKTDLEILDDFIDLLPAVRLKELKVKLRAMKRRKMYQNNHSVRAICDRSFKRFLSAYAMLIVDYEFAEREIMKTSGSSAAGETNIIPPDNLIADSAVVEVNDQR